ncbi:MAG: prepilin-type N-terminal cleavage/methylation domain-containing protein [Planctomycetota bacterium]|nr:prepilin-type N-terminal cleavage/methylation domain-containing protein [Planctomycetota bacterium]
MNGSRFYPARRALAARGMTLLEVMISLVVITLVIMTTVLVMHSTSDHMRFEMVVSDQQNHTRATLDRMMEELRRMPVSTPAEVFDTNSGVGTNTTVPMSDTAANLANGVKFYMPTYNNATLMIDNGSPVTYQWEPSPAENQTNGVDDDGNGLKDADDGRIVRIDNSGLVVVLNNVPRTGFLIAKSGRRLQVRVAQKNNTPLQTGEGTTISTAVTHNTYCLRNY